MAKLIEMHEKYNHKTQERPNWGFDYKYEQLSEEVGSSENSKINNRSFIIAISYAGKKILIPGDMEIDGWQVALQKDKFKEIVKDTNFFIASHHGHKSGFTSGILTYSGNPDLFIVSERSGDESVDTSYSKPENCKGYCVNGKNRYMVSTRKDGSIKISICRDGSTSVNFIDCQDNLNANQQKIRNRRSAQSTLQRLTKLS
jgi:hypothetical protein